MPLSFRRRRWILCSAANGVNVVMYKPIFERLKDDPRLKILHTAKLTHTRESVRDYDGDVHGFFAQFGIRHGVMRHNFAKYLPYDLYLSPNFVERCHPLRAKVRVQCFHGVSFKNCAVTEKTYSFDRLFLPGPYHRRRFLERGLYREGDPKLQMVGLPKLDRLVDGSIDRTQVLLAKQLDPSKPTVLYAPTGDRGNSLNRQGEAIIQNVLDLDVNLIVKLHDHSSPDPLVTFDWREKLRSWKHDRLRVDFGSDVVPLLAAADVLISDASSVAFEYTLRDRPILFMDVPEILNGKRSEGAMDLDTWGRKGGEVIADAKELREAIPRALESPHEKSAVRRAIAQDLFFEPGTATARAARTIYDLLELDPPSELAGVAAATAG
jgi:CDP-Glycerol:Poly(glycerophosphate) glycerophosphotransferase